MRKKFSRGGGNLYKPNKEYSDCGFRENNARRKRHTDAAHIFRALKVPHRYKAADRRKTREERRKYRVGNKYYRDNAEQNCKNYFFCRRVRDKADRKKRNRRNDYIVRYTEKIQNKQMIEKEQRKLHNKDYAYDYCGDNQIVVCSDFHNIYSI